MNAMTERPNAFLLLCVPLALSLGTATSAFSRNNALPHAPQDLRPLQCELNDAWIGNGIAYGPHRDGQRPGGDGPSREQLAEDLAIMQKHWKLLRVYAANDTAEAMLDLIRSHGHDIRVVIGAWIDPTHSNPGVDADARSPGETAAANRRQVARAIQLANRYNDIVIAVSVGNETQVSWSSHRVAPDTLIEHIREVRRHTNVPVTTADDYTFWLETRSKPIAAEVDFIMTHIHAMWRGQKLADAVMFTQRQYAAVQAKHPNHLVAIGEAGWATRKHTQGDQAKYIQGTPGEIEQKRFYDVFRAWITRAKIPSFFFEAFDEKWKGGPHPNEVEKHWGLYQSDRTPKLAMRSRLGIVSEEWTRRVCNLAWICYAPSESNPLQQKYAAPDSIRADLVTLRNSGFSGLITYSCKHPTIRAVSSIAAQVGFDGAILGIWNPLDAEECKAACELAQHDIVLGLCIGNEGLGTRYSYEQLVQTLDRLRTATNKPVTTTEEVEDYLERHVLDLGDWAFPNAHPVYHGRTRVEPALRWTIGAFRELRHRTDRFVWLKEVGWPSDGGDGFTPAAQRRYYAKLAESDVTFAYFEAFDQPWKDWHACEPFFGLFDARRSPKPLVATMKPDGPSTLNCHEDSAVTTQPATSERPRNDRLYVYRDHCAPVNHFTPTGRQGDEGDVLVDEVWTENVRSGGTCLRVILNANGSGPHGCEYVPPCRWAGLRWLQPAHNWGRAAEHAGKGLDLRGYRRVVFWARAAKPCTVTFSVGGVDADYGDSLTFPARAVCRLNEQWHRFTIDLDECELDHIIAGFGCASSWDSNPDGVILYLDDIYFE